MSEFVSGDLIAWVEIRLDVSVKERTKSAEVVLLWRCCGSATLCVLCACMFMCLSLGVVLPFTFGRVSTHGIATPGIWPAACGCARVIESKQSPQDVDQKELTACGIAAGEPAQGARG